jgi:hypothetical protein
MIYEIFQYIDALELYRCFFNLNCRMNNILNSISNLKFQVNSLADATRFPNVRSLEFFDFLSEQQLAQVRHKHVGHLTYLRMCRIEDYTTASAFFQMIFFE